MHWWRYNAVLRSRKSVISWHLLPGRSSQLLFIDFAGLYCASGVHYMHYWASRLASVALLGVDISLSPVKRMELLLWESSFLPFCLTLSPVGGFFFFREVKVVEVKPKEVQLSVERVPGTLSTASKSVQVNGAATVSIDFFFSFLMLTPLLRHLNQIKSISAWTKGGGGGVNESCLYSATSRIDFNYR